MKPSHAQWLKRLPALFEIPAPDPARLLRRIVMMERNIMLPVKAVFIGMILYSFHIHAVVRLAVAARWTWRWKRCNSFSGFTFWPTSFLPRCSVRGGTTAAGGGAMDGGHEQPGGRIVYRGAWRLLTGGLDSILFWLFVALIVRNAVSVPPGFSQLFLNFAISLCYVLVAVLDVSVMQQSG